MEGGEADGDVKEERLREDCVESSTAFENK